MIQLEKAQHDKHLYPDALKFLITELNEALKELNVEKMVEKHGFSDPDFLEKFGMNPDALQEWQEWSKKQILNLGVEAVNQISI